MTLSSLLILLGVAFHEGTNGRVALMLPGKMYTPDHPLLYYTRQVLLTHGWSVDEVWWSADDLQSEEAVVQRAKEALDKVADRTPLVVGKSLGYFALPLVAERGWPAIWLTPLLSLPEFTDALKASTGKTLLVGGTADDFWDSALANSSGHQVLEMPGAHHGLEISGDPLASVHLLGELVEAISLFVENL